MTQPMGEFGDEPNVADINDNEAAGTVGDPTDPSFISRKD